MRHICRSGCTEATLAYEALKVVYAVVAYIVFNFTRTKSLLRHDHFCSFKHHADVEPCKFLVSLAASSISEIYYCNPRSKKCSINSVFAIFFIYTFSPTFLMKAIF